MSSFAGTFDPRATVLEDPTFDSTMSEFHDLMTSMVDDEDEKEETAMDILETSYSSQYQKSALHSTENVPLPPLMAAINEDEDASSSSPSRTGRQDSVDQALLVALHEERRRSELLAEDVCIAKAEKESEIVEHKLTIQRLHNKMKTVIKERSLEEVYQVMEEECKRLTAELNDVRARNLVLENKEMDKNAEQTIRRVNNNNNNSESMTSEYLDQTTNKTTKTTNINQNSSTRLPQTPGGDKSTFVTHSHSPSGAIPEISFGEGYNYSHMNHMTKTLDGTNHTNNGNNTTIVTTFTANQLANREIKRLTSRIKAQNNAVERLQKESEELKAQGRLHSISLRQSKDAARRVFLATQTCDSLKGKFEHETEVSAHAKRNLHLVRGEIATLHDTNRELNAHLTVAAEKIAHYEKMLSETSRLADKEKKMNRFVMKHITPGGTPVGAIATVRSANLGNFASDRRRAAATERQQQEQEKGIGNARSTYKQTPVQNQQHNRFMENTVLSKSGGGDNNNNHNGNGNGNGNAPIAHTDASYVYHDGPSFRTAIRKGNRNANAAHSQVSKHLHLDVDVSRVNDHLSQLRATCVFKCPELLPYIRELVESLHVERQQWRIVSASPR